MQTENEKEKFAFVLMPFDPEFDGIYADLIVPALESAGYQVRRADSPIDQRNILKDIVRGIDHADLIVAELTSLNPNVLYELGIAHALLKPTVMLTQDIESVPFDLRSYRVMVYSTRYNEVKELQDHLYEIAQELKEGPISFENPVTDFAPSLLGSRETIGRRPKPEEEVEPAAIAEEEEPGMLDFVVEAERSMEEIIEYTDKVNELTSSLSQKMTARTAEFESIKGRATPGSAARMHKVAKAVASDMIEYAEKVEAELPRLHDSWERFAENTTNLFSMVRIENAEDREALMSLVSSMEKAEGELGGAVNATQSAHESLKQMYGVSRDLNRAVRRTERAIEGISEEFAVGESYVARMLNVLRERLDTQGGEEEVGTSA